jgi:hypothetical protein
VRNAYNIGMAASSSCAFTRLPKALSETDCGVSVKVKPPALPRLLHQTGPRELTGPVWGGSRVTGAVVTGPVAAETPPSFYDIRRSLERRTIVSTARTSSLTCIRKGSVMTNTVPPTSSGCFPKIALGRAKALR